MPRLEKAIQAERLWEVGAELAEGPVWDKQTQEVVWVDVLPVE